MNTLLKPLALTAALVLSTNALGDINLTLTPPSSSVTASGNASGFSLTPQGTGANVTTFSGPVVISDTAGGTVTFISANATAANSGNWQPLPGGAAGTAPANYGLRQTLLGANAALRNGRVGLTSSSLTLTGSGGAGTFPANSVTVTVLQGDLDYNAGGLGTGTGTIAGQTVPAAPAGVNGNIAIAAGTMTLTLPIDATITQVQSGLTISVRLQGTLVATAPAPISTGACCRGSTCAVTTSAACPAAANQRYTGNGTVCNAAGNNTTPCCKADFNQSGGSPPVTVQDIFDFLAAYFSNNAAADINGVSGITVQDIFDFLAAYFAGC